MNKHPQGCFFHTITSGMMKKMHQSITLTDCKKEEYYGRHFHKAKGVGDLE